MSIARVKYNPMELVLDGPYPQQGDRFDIPKLKEKATVELPNKLGDILDILSGLYGVETKETKRMHDHLHAKAQTLVHGMGLYLQWSDAETQYVLVPDIDRELGR